MNETLLEKGKGERMKDEFIRYMQSTTLRGSKFKEPDEGNAVPRLTRNEAR